MLKRQFGLDKPLPTQYLIWLVGNDWMKVDTDGDGIADSYGHAQGHPARRLSAFPSARASRCLTEIGLTAAQHDLPDGELPCWWSRC